LRQRQEIQALLRTVGALRRTTAGSESQSWEKHLSQFNKSRKSTHHREHDAHENANHGGKFWESVFFAKQEQSAGKSPGWTACVPSKAIQTAAPLNVLKNRTGTTALSRTACLVQSS
jgi:hypothetical protein